MKDNYAHIEQVYQVFRNGGTAVFPTDTVYGLGACAFDSKAVAKIYAIKGRVGNKPLSIVVKDIDLVRQVALLSPAVERFLSAIWPGPITVILPKRGNSLLADAFIHQDTIAVRVPKHPFLTALLAHCNYPIIATSANLSGEPEVHDSAEITKIFSDRTHRPDVIIDAGTLEPNPPSTILDLSTGQARIVRAGSVDAENLIALYNKSSNDN